MKKEKILYLIIIILNLIVVIRVFDLTIIKNDYYRNLLHETTSKMVKSSSAPRGRILDAKGNILVDNIGVKTLFYNKIPSIDKEEEISIAMSLSNILKMDIKVDKLTLKKFYYIKNKKEIDALVDKLIIDKVEKRLITQDEFMNYKYSLITDEMLKEVDLEAAYIYDVMNKGYNYQNKEIKKQLTDEEMTKINELNMPGIHIDITWVRKYNYDTCLNTLFGAIGSIAKEDVNGYLENGYALDDIVGVSFLEKSYEEYLKGEKAVYKVMNDNTLEIYKEESRGSDLILNIDINLQMQIEELLKKEILAAKKYSTSKYYQGSYIVISNPLNGAIKAMVALKYNGTSFQSDVIGLLTNSYTVGSVVKGASQTTAYYYNVLDEKTRINDACIKLYSQKEKCSWKRLGVLNDIDALAYSSNYFQFLNAIKVSGYKYKRNMKFNPTLDDFNKYRDIFKSYGLGVKTEIDISEEQLGITGKEITGDLLLNLTIGQYDTYTPLMLNQYISTIANGGNRYKLRIADAILTSDGTKIPINQSKVLNKVDIKPKYLKRIQKGFRKVSISGTGASYVNKKYQAAGKTGTSETFYNGHQTTTKSFVMYAPFDNPEYSISIISPNIGYQNPTSNYKYPINSHLSRQITNILFDN